MVDASPEAKLPPGAIAASRLQNLLIGFMRTKAIHVAAQLDIADHLAVGELTAEDLAQRVGANSAALHRLLRALCSIGIFREQEGRYGMTSLAEPLRADAPSSVRPFALLLGHPAWWQAWGNLRHAVVTGESAFEHEFGTGAFAYMEDHPDLAAAFNAGLAGIATANARPLLEACAFAGCRTVVDVGDGHGAFLQAVLAAHPQARGILFDTPQVIASRAGGDVERRLTGVGGDFLQGVPPGGDAYILQQVLRDWDDATAQRILADCRDAMAPGGRVLIIDAVIPPGNTLNFNKFTDLHMLVLTHGGRERTEEEFRTLFASAGLALTRVTSTPTAFTVLETRRVP